MLLLMTGIFEKLIFQSICLSIALNFKLFVTINKQDIKMTNKIDKETQERKEFYENFLKFTSYSTIIVIAIVALMAIFLV